MRNKTNMIPPLSHPRNSQELIERNGSYVGGCASVCGLFVCYASLAFEAIFSRQQPDSYSKKQTGFSFIKLGTVYR